MNLTFWKRFLSAWLIAFLSLSLTRLVFYFNLQTYFESDLSNLVHSFLFGIRFDAVAIAYLLGPFFIALPFLRKGISENIAKVYYICMLGFMSLLNCIDAEFFRFTARRSTDDLFEYAFLSDDFVNIAPNLLSSFWHLLLALVAIMLLSLWSYSKLFKRTHENRNLVFSFLYLLPTALVLVLAARGGVQNIPLTIIDAGKTEVPALSAVTLNTPFTILKTLGKPELIRFEFEPGDKTTINPIITSSAKAPYKLRGSNVVVIIMESFAKEYIGALNGLKSGYTPFLDSLCAQSLVFPNAYANGQRSIEGIPAVVASIPTLMYEPYTTSRYAGNQINSLASILKQENYYTSFMHGGNKGSMNFESFALHAGYDIFYYRDDYPFPDKHYDGYWGISDHYFFNHCVEKFSEYQEPFVSSIFTLSSHHPYSLPKEHQNIYPKGTLPIHESIGYADEALRQFFANASKTDWYDNTIFVITADHTSLSEHAQYQTKLGALSIPILFFHPNDTVLRGINEQVTQQVDIMPTILNLLEYKKPFFAFGVSAFNNTSEHTAVAFKHDQHQLLKDNILVCFDGTSIAGVYDVKDDALLQNNLVNKGVDFKKQELFLKGYLENYSDALIKNRMTNETWERNKK